MVDCPFCSADVQWLFSSSQTSTPSGTFVSGTSSVCRPRHRIRPLRRYTTIHCSTVGRYVSPSLAVIRCSGEWVGNSSAMIWPVRPDFHASVWWASFAQLPFRSERGRRVGARCCVLSWLALQPGTYSEFGSADKWRLPLSSFHSHLSVPVGTLSVSTLCGDLVGLDPLKPLICLLFLRSARR